MSHTESPKIPLLNADNFHTWQVDMQAMLILKGLWSAVTEDEAFKKKEADVQKEMQLKAQALMIVSTSRSVKGLVNIEGSAKQTWKSLIAYFQVTTSARATDLHAKMMAMRQGTKEKMVEFILRVQDIRNQLGSCGEQVSNALAISVVLSGLQRRYANLAETLRCQNDLNWDVMISRLIAGESRSEVKEDTTEGKALPHVGGYQPKGKQAVEKRSCYNCGLKGHLKKDCRKPIKEKADGATCLAVVGSNPKTWDGIKPEDTLLDTGASHHICCDRDAFVDLSPSSIETVACGGGEIHTVIGQGTVVVDTQYGPVNLTDALCVPTLKANLLSWPAASSNGASLEGAGTRLSIRVADKTILTAHKKSGVFLVDGVVTKSVTEGIACPVSAACWHKRLGHVSDAVLTRMVQEELVEGLQIADKVECALSCDACFEGKQARLPFDKSSSRATRVLELVHSDVIGKFQVESEGGARYALTVLDDFSRYSEVLLLKTKAEVPKVLIDVLVRWERQTEQKVKTLRTDGGSEYGQQLSKKLVEMGVVHQKTVRYTPQHNGRAERLNRTLLEKTRCMLFEAQMPIKFWGEALATANYLRNMTAAATSETTPFEAFKGEKPDIGMLRTFGCVTHVQVPRTTKRKKLDKRSFKAMFVGYEAGRKGWRVLATDGQKWTSIVTRDAAFEEEKMAFPLLSTNAEETDYDELLVKPLPSEAWIEDDDDQGQGIDETNSDITSDEDTSSNDSDDVTASGDSEDTQEDSEDTANDNNPMPPGRTRMLSEIIQDLTEATAMNVVGYPDLTDDPLTVEEVLSRPDSELWIEAMNSELASLNSKGVYEETELPQGHKPIPAKWVFKVKRDASGKVDKYKARLVAKGFLQKFGPEGPDVYAPTSNLVTLRMLLAKATREGLAIHQLDVKTAFLNGDLHDEVYLKLPPNCTSNNIVWRLKKALYGLKQAAIAWYEKLTKTMKEAGFIPAEADPCLYTLVIEGQRVHVLVHVDDCLIVGQEDQVLKTKEMIANMFEIDDKGEATYFLGMEIIRSEDRKETWLGQRGFIKGILKKFNMEQSKPRVAPMDANTQMKQEGEDIESGAPYRELVGSLLYLAHCTRPDIAHSVGMLSRFVQKPTANHWKAGKDVLRYLAGTRDLGFCSRLTNDVDMHGYSDADFAGDSINRRSTSGYVFISDNAAVSWASKLQTLVATSTCEAELIAYSVAVKEALYIAKVLCDISGDVEASEGIL